LIGNYLSQFEKKNYYNIYTKMMKTKTKYSKRVVGAPNTNKEKVLGPNNSKEWVVGQPIQ
jgi:hypothetical protein